MNIIPSNTQTMTSREISKATGKRHADVMRDIRVMFGELEENADLHLAFYKSSGREYPEYKLPKSEVITLVTGYNAKLRKAVVDRLEELEAKEKVKLSTAQSRQAARLEAPLMTDAVKDSREEAKHYHYSNEFNMINRLVLGMTAKQYRNEHGIEKADAIRDCLTQCEIAAIEHLQRANTTMIEIGLDFNERKNKLAKLLVEKHSRKLLAEFERLEY